MARWSRLDEETVDKIVGATMNGSSVDDAAQANAVHRSTVHRWLKRGREAIEARENPWNPRNIEDDLFVDLAERVEQARYQAKVEAELILRQFMLGIDEEETTDTEEYDPTNPHADSETGLYVTKRVRKKRKRRDLRAVLEWLRARYPQEYAVIFRGELSGPGGEPLIPTAQRASKLADEAEQYLASRNASPDEQPATDAEHDRPSG